MFIEKIKIPNLEGYYNTGGSGKEDAGDCANRWCILEHSTDTHNAKVIQAPRDWKCFLPQHCTRRRAKEPFVGGQKPQVIRGSMNSEKWEKCMGEWKKKKYEIIGLTETWNRR